MNNLPAEKNRRILIIDDNRAIHDDFRKILSPDTIRDAAMNVTETELFGKPGNVTREIQYEIDSAYQGEDGVMRVKQALEEGRPYAMAFVDIRMPPGMDGVETTRKIWTVDPEVQIVLCTAYADYSWDEMFEKIGDSDGLVILKKPFDNVEALQLAHALTEKWWLHRQAMRKMEELENQIAERTGELQWKTTFLEAQVNSSIDGIMVVDEHGEKILQNQRLADLFKIPPHVADDKSDEKQLQWITDLMKNPVQFIEKVVYLTSHPNEISRDEIELKNGTVLDRYSSPVTGQDGKYYGRIWTFRDITERKQGEEALQESQALYHSLVDELPIGIFRKDRAGRFVFANPWFCQLRGLQLDQIVGRTADELVALEEATHGQTRPEVLKSIREGTTHHEEIMRTGMPIQVDEIHPTAGEGKRYLHVLKSAVFGPNGKIIGTQGVQFDITERKRLEARLFQSQKMETVGKLAGGIAHEFNSILTAVIGQSELLLGDLPTESPLAKNAMEINMAAGRAATLTRQLLAYGRKQILQPEALDLNSILTGMESTLRHLTGVNTDVRIVPGTGLKTVKADAGQIEQVVLNIAMNAADAMPNGGNLTLETANVSFDPESVGRYPELKPGDYVMLAISDTGPGMSEEIKAHVFEPFFSTKDVGQGTGLGLSTCYGIVKQSGGHISVYSEPGRGTTFKIFLPQLELPPEIFVQRHNAPDLPHGTETILLVEDDPALREMAATLLRRLGYTVLAAANGIEALGLKQQRGIGHVDLLFTDVVMPHMNGKELADRVRALNPRTKILFTSAYTENAIVHQGVLDKGVALLQKPFTPSALANKLREVLDQPGAQKTPSFTDGNTPS
jgi:two-component system cell cycle sensor histidine kinase/response regulator CckA